MPWMNLIIYISIEKTTNLWPAFSFGFSSDKLIWRSDDTYGGSNNYFENVDKQNPRDNEKSAYVNLRIFLLIQIKTGKKKSSLLKIYLPSAMY